MAVRYTARMQFQPGQDSGLISDEFLEACRVGQIDEVMFFAFAEEQNDGHDTLKRIQSWMDTLRPWKHALEAEGIEVSLNPWHSLLHTDRGRRLKPGQSWQTMVDWRGYSASAVVCPLDPAWRDYYAKAMRIFAAEHFRVIWIDDDIRYHNHAPLDWGGCWCPLHVAEFVRRAGTSASREEIVSRAIQSGEPHPWRGLWFDMWEDSHVALLDSWREIVEGAGSRLGLMSSSVEAHAMEGRDWSRWWHAIARESPPVHRPHFWGYSETPAPILVYGISQMQQHRALRPAAIESDPEIECFPYGPWNKSFRQTLAQMALAQVFGSDRLAISLYDFMGNLPSDEPERAKFLARVKPVLDWLGEQFPPSWTSYGAGVPWRADFSRNVHTDGRNDWRSLEVASRGWDNWLGAFGIAFQKEPHASLNALAGTMVWGYDEDTLRAWLAAGLLLDGPAAAAMVERGLGELIGLADTRFITQDEVLYSMEESLDAEFGLRPSAQMSLNADKPYANRLLQGQLLSGARLISDLRDPTQRVVGHGALAFENSLGGRVVVVPWDASAGTNLCTQRRAQLAKVLAWLARGVSLGSVAGGAWLVPQFLTDGTRWRGVVWNASPDAVREIQIRPPDAMGLIQRAVHCGAEGNRAEAVVRSNLVALAQPLQQWEWVVLNPD
ncbi:MAG: hypothetical protein HZB26_15075 [Candidatus Hydrogenedentes bacterium]|nr:hypothetical protein [Candidatus Hydrogenedentota bacterium]